jgi:alanine racemase
MKTTPLHSSWCEISCAKIEQNLRIALDILPAGSRFCAVLKADAYGHGIENVVPILLAHKISHVGITSNSEALAVREAGFEGTIMRLRTATFEEAVDALPFDVEEQVSTVEAAQAFAGLMEKRDSAIPLHLSLNAGGMSRDGLELSMSSGRESFARIISLVGDRIVGICTHFPSNLTEDLQVSITRFHHDVNWVFRNAPLKREDIIVHGGSSLTLISGERVGTDMMRCGAILYGIAKPELGFRTTMTLKARVTSIGTFPQGSTIGYDRSACLSEDKLLANISIGYSNGYIRQLSGRSHVLIRGKRLPVLGKISMNTIVADVTSLKGVQVGDEVVAFGSNGEDEISVPMIEEQSGTIIADLYTDWGHRNPRIIC